MPRVSQVDTSNSGVESGVVWGQQDSNQSLQNNNKSDEPDQDAEITKK